MPGNPLEIQERLFLELLYASLSDTPPWDRALIERRMLRERVID